MSKKSFICITENLVFQNKRIQLHKSLKQGNKTDRDIRRI